MCAKSGSTGIYTFRNITNKLFSPVKAFDPGFKLQWNPVNTNTFGPWKIGRINGVVLLRGSLNKEMTD